MAWKRMQYTLFASSITLFPQARRYFSGTITKFFDEVIQLHTLLFSEKLFLRSSTAPGIFQR